MIVSPRLAAIAPLLAMRAPPTSMLAMPVAATVADGLVTAAGAGSVAIAVQLAGVALIRAIPEDKRSIMFANSGYVVYKSVALLLIVVQTIIGALWYFPAVGATSASRLLAPDGTVRFLAAVVFGTLVMWDLPCAVFIKRIRKPDMIAHHVGVATIAFVMMAYLPNAFGLFYLGAQEISSVPVCVWNFYTNADDAAATPQWSERVSPPALKRIQAARDISQLAAAVAFVLVRGIEFTRITATRLLPDMRAVLPTPAAAASATALRIGLVGALCFNALQLFWLYQIVSVMIEKIFFGGDGVPERDRK